MFSVFFSIIHNGGKEVYIILALLQKGSQNEVHGNHIVIIKQIMTAHYSGMVVALVWERERNVLTGDCRIDGYVCGRVLQLESSSFNQKPNSNKFKQ